ncbi:MAG: hypothetical protein P4M15_13435 [Alphaproteobacteria bacterium]|nr:hypothetical protein [Alphaproteobacteria bacterium]
MSDNFGWITYYWSAPAAENLQAALAAGNMPNLGVVAGGVGQDGVTVYGDTGLYYTVARSRAARETPEGFALADPYICTGLMGVFA